MSTRQSFRSIEMLKNAYSPANISADTAENERFFSKFAKIGNSPADQAPVLLNAPRQATSNCRGSGVPTPKNPILSRWVEAKSMYFPVPQGLQTPP